MELLAESAVRITVLAVGVAAILRALRICVPRLARLAWFAVTVIMLLLPFFVAWGLELALPLPPLSTGVVFAPALDAGAASPGGTRMTTVSSPDGAHTGVITWASTALTVYLVGVGWFLVRLLIGWRRARALRRSAVRVHGRLTHPACMTPMTVGLIAPVVILPSDWTRWSEAELSAVLAHEEEHVRQRDPLVAGVVLLNRAIFWFHPLAWWLRRTIARLSEQACDAVVISGGHDSDAYSACLLRFARRAAGAGGRIAPMATAMPGSALRERLRMLAHQLPSPPSPVRLACAAASGALLLVICAAATPAAAPAQNPLSLPRSQATWSVATSEHFEIVHDDLLADRVSEVVRDIEAAYAHVSTALKHELRRPVRVILVRRDGDIGGHVASVVPPGGAATGDQRVVISMESLDRRTGLIVHELTHQFAFEIVPETSRIAPVLIEGLAEHQRGAWAAEDLRMIRAAAGARAIPSMASLVNTDRHWAHAVFDFVAAQHGAEGVRRLLFALRAHDTLPPAVAMAFGITLEQFDEQFRSYVTATFGQP